MEIDPKVLFVASHSIRIEAPPATVWRLLSEIDGWPSWHAAIARATLAGPLASGSKFHCYVLLRGWVNAGDLHSGMAVRQADARCEGLYVRRETMRSLPPPKAFPAPAPCPGSAL